MKDWSLILIDASLRGLCQADLARELGCSHSVVHYKARAYGVKLPRSVYNHDRNTKKVVETKRKRNTDRWARRFAVLTGPVTVNEFCRLYRCSPTSATNHAKLHGYIFAPSGARRTRNA